MTIGVLGAGYVGLGTAASFAARGFSVVCADVNESRILGLQRGELPFFEAGLQELLVSALNPIVFTAKVEEACACDVVFCCVGTPSAPDGSADLSYVESAAQSCAQKNPGTIFVLKSTVPPGTSQMIAEHVEHKLCVAANPEFLREGRIVEDALNPSRIVIGVDDEKTLEVMREIYQGIDAPIVETDTKTAELIKYASNSFLATKISFINEIAGLCDVIGADVKTVARGMGLDDRIGSKFLQPGPGFGGSCFPKDVRALQCLARSRGENLEILDATMRVNDMRQKLSVLQVKESLGDLGGKRIAVWGLAFKPETDDIRDAPALAVISELLGQGAIVVAYDPMVKALPAPFFSVIHAPSPHDAICDADALIVMTDWTEFSSYKKTDLKQKVRSHCVVDLRGILK